MSRLHEPAAPQGPKRFAVPYYLIPEDTVTDGTMKQSRREAALCFLCGEPVAGEASDPCAAHESCKRVYDSARDDEAEEHAPLRSAWGSLMEGMRARGLNDFDKHEDEGPTEADIVAEVFAALDAAEALPPCPIQSDEPERRPTYSAADPPWPVRPKCGPPRHHVEPSARPGGSTVAG